MTEFFHSDGSIIIAWVSLWLAVSLLYRASRGKPIFYHRLSNVRFRQVNASGKSHKNFFTRLGNANNCLVVQVTDKELDIHPFAPFNWFFIPELSGLEYRVPLDRILSAKIVKKLFWRRVEIEIQNEEGNVEKISLYLKKPEDFLTAIGHPPETRAEQPMDQGFAITSKPIVPGD